MANLDELLAVEGIENFETYINSVSAEGYSELFYNGAGSESMLAAQTAWRDLGIKLPSHP